MKDLVFLISAIVVIIAILCGNLFPQLSTLFGWIMIAAIIVCACVAYVDNMDNKK